MSNPSLLPRAADVVCEYRSGSIALLQRHLLVGYGEARELAAQLASRGILDAPNPDGRYRRLSPLKVVLQNSSSERHARALRDLALYVLECGDGLDSRCVALLLDPLKCDLSQVRAVAAAHRGQDVLAVARALGELPALRPPQECHPDFEQVLLEVCAGASLVPNDAADTPSEQFRKSLVRAVRYLDKRLHDGWGPHSRCLDYFVPMVYVPQGHGLEGNPTYCEHVVPCVMLCAEATRMLEHGVAVEEVAEWIGPYLRIVWIDPRLAAKLDHDLKLKTTMPGGWEFGRGCTYARLHAADILFMPPQSGPECCGWTIDRHLDPAKALERAKA